MRRYYLRIVATLLVVCASPVLAQFHSGAIVGSVGDTSGGSLPAVTVTLTGIGAKQTFVTTDSGLFHFVALAPGFYKVTAERSGFGSVTRRVEVNTGSSSDVELTMNAAVSESTTVSAETPLVDTRKVGTGTTVTRAELDKFAGAHNPWTVMATAGGVLGGGGPDSKQGLVVSKGVPSSQTTFNIDGVNITDMAATGASPMYYNFDAWQEMQVTTSSSDPRVLTPGLQLNMVSRRGANAARGSARWFWTDHRLQAATAMPAEARTYLAQTSHVDHIDEYGIEGGGPLIRDRLWVWGAYGGNRVNLLPAIQVSAAPPPGIVYEDHTTIANWNARLSGQIAPNNSVDALFDRSEKKVAGRGVGPQRPPETGWDQSGPVWLAKAEDTHVFGQRVYVTAFVSRTSSEFRLVPVSGMDHDAWQDASSIWHTGQDFYETIRPQRDQKIEGGLFIDGNAIQHELKFGFEYRSAPVTSVSVWPGTGNTGQIVSGNSGYALLLRQNRPRYSTDYRNLFVGDTALWNRLTVQLGARFDVQSGRNLSGSVPANTVVPDLLPAATYAGDLRSLHWRTVSPRIGMTYVLGQNRRTLLRGAYNRYTDQLGSSNIAKANPFYNQYLVFNWIDANGDKGIQRDEIQFDEGLVGSGWVDLNSPTSNGSPYRIDYGTKATTTDEFIAGAEQEITPGFTVALNLTRRRRQNFTWLRFEKTRGAGDYYTSADYVLKGNVNGQLPDGRTYSVPYYRLAPGTPVPTYAVLTNRPNYSQRYDGAELDLTKRMTGWLMLRANVSWNDWIQYVGDGAFVDPTVLLDPENGCNRCSGAPVEMGADSGAGMNSRWSYAVNALAKLPRRFSVSAILAGGEGYIITYTHRVNPGDGSNLKSVLPAGVDPARLPNGFVVNLNLDKEFTVRGTSGLTLSADAYNVTNRQSVTLRQARLYNSATVKTPSANRILDLQNPRVVRLGMRVSF